MKHDAGLKEKTEALLRQIEVNHTLDDYKARAR